MCDCVCGGDHRAARLIVDNFLKEVRRTSSYGFCYWSSGTLFRNFNAEKNRYVVVSNLTRIYVWGKISTVMMFHVKHYHCFSFR